MANPDTPAAAPSAPETAAIAAPRDLVPYDGLCNSKGGMWALLVTLLPPVALIAALLIGYYYTDFFNAWYIAACIAGFLLLYLILFAIMFYGPGDGDYHFQIWCLQNPSNPLTNWLPAGAALQGAHACDNAWMHSRRLKYGPNFVVAGEVCLGEHAEVERALLAPQQRTYYLGQLKFIKKHCPGDDLGQRSTFLLSMSDGADDDRHGKFRACLGRYFFGSLEFQARREDSVARGMIEQLAKDYEEKRAFFFSERGPLERFLIKYLHYVLFGAVLEGEDLEVLESFLAGGMPILHYFWPIGYIFNKKKLIDKVAAIYERSPALSMFEEGVAAHAKMTKAELARMMTGMMRVAGKTGSMHILSSALGGAKLPNYAGENTGSIDVTKVWDTLNLDDRDELKRFVVEVARLWPPVNVGHRVATEAFTCDFKGRAVSFPAGTIVMVPMVFGNLDKGFWGPTTYEFDHNRPNLLDRFLGFNSVGDRDGGRMCPGRGLVLDMCADILAALGRTRRPSAARGDVEAAV